MSQSSHPFSCPLFPPSPGHLLGLQLFSKAVPRVSEEWRDTCKLGYQAAVPLMHILAVFKDLDSGLSLPTPVTLAIFLTLSLSRNDHAGDAPSGQGRAYKGATRPSPGPWGESGRRGGAGGGAGGGASGGPRQPGRSGRRSRASESRSHVRGSAAEFLVCGGRGPPGVRRDGETRSGARARAGGGAGTRLRPDAAATPGALSPAPAVGAPRAAVGSAPRARGMRAADSGTWERVRQLAAQGEPAPSCGAGAGPARPPGPPACEPGADAAGPGDRPRAGAPSVRADGDCSQPGRCAPGGEGGAAAGRGRAGAGRAGALPAGIGPPLVAKFSPRP